MTKQYAGKVDFVFIYCKEAHPENTEPVTTYSERLERARLFVRAMKTQQRVLVDEFEERSVQQRYGALSDTAFVLDKNGRVTAKLAIADAFRLEDAMRECLGEPPVKHDHPRPIDLTGPAEASDEPKR